MFVLWTVIILETQLLDVPYVLLLKSETPNVFIKVKRPWFILINECNVSIRTNTTNDTTNNKKKTTTTNNYCY